MDLSAIPVHDIPADGLHLEGQLPKSIFDLAENDVQAAGPVEYSVDLVPGGDCIVATGRVAVEFELECARCLGRFRQRIELDPYEADIDPEGKHTINLTDRLREDILLDLPAYPRCDQGTEPRQCPVGDRFAAPSPVEEGPGESGPPQAPGAWEALEGWEPREPSS